MNNFNLATPGEDNNPFVVLDPTKGTKGRVSIKITDHETGEQWWHTQNNLVVTQGRVEECHIIAGDDTLNRVITNLQVGDGGHVVGDPNTPVPPQAADVALENSVFTKALGAPSFPVPTTVEFYAILTESEAVGAQITEAGLFCLNTSMFARITFEVIPKTASRTVEFYWRIIY